ncbi:MAG: tRNA lysidine(34) synthetase TilS [Solirubrobacterales bacterium]
MTNPRGRKSGWDRTYDRGVLPSPAIEDLVEVVESGGLVDPRSSGIVLVSGGADSACAAAALVGLCGPEAVAGLHVNYALRLDSDRDEQAARALCAKLRIDLHVARPDLPAGNVQARAREARYAAAIHLRERLGCEWIATGHTRSDLAETLLYRLAVSPGTRPLLGLAPRSGRIVRPLHSIPREKTRSVAAQASLPFVDDPTNALPQYARNRIRAEVLPVLAEIGPEVERNIAATHAELHEEAELLAGLVAETLERAGVTEGSTEIASSELEQMQPGLQRLVLRELAGRVAGRPPALSRSRSADIGRLASRPEGGQLNLGGCVRVRCEGHRVRFLAPAADPDPDLDGQGAALHPVRMSVPGRARFGDWELRAELIEGPVEPAGPGFATLDAGALGDQVEIRAWRSGDRIRPLGLGGSKSLQDLFTDRGVPRSQRGRVPVVTAGGRVAWVAGVAVSEEFRLGARSAGVAVITLRPAA